MLTEVRAALADTGIRIGDVEVIRLKSENDWDLFARFCSRSQALDARNILVAGDDTDKARLIDNFGRFCDLAATHRLTADLEFVPWTAVPDLAAASAVVEAAGRVNGGILVDALHYHRSQTTLAQIAEIPHHRVNYVQFCDGVVPYDRSDSELIPIARTERLFPGMGGIDLVGLVRSIREGVPISVEVPHRVWATKIDAMGRAAMAREATLAVLRAAERGGS